jgi:peptidoglycan/LPS O-acetylase OafA/YrhL
MNGKSRLEELDSLRGLAAISVLIFHYFYLFNNLYKHPFNIPDWIEAGHMGVPLFFMISGFVIFMSVSNQASPLGFIWSRWSRLFPVYWAAVLLTSSIVSIFGLENKELLLHEVLLNLTMVQSLLGVPNADDSYWTLLLELFFYFWILMLLICKQLKNIEKWLLFWISMAGGVTFAAEILGLSISWKLERLFLTEYIYFFASGICFYLIYTNKNTNLSYVILVLSVVFIFVISAHNQKHFLSIFICYGTFTLFILNKLSFLKIKPLVFLGSISYSLYLVHQNIGYVIINKSYEYNLSAFVAISSATLVSFFIAILLTFYIERPILKFLRKVYKNRLSQIGVVKHS